MSDNNIRLRPSRQIERSDAPVCDALPTSRCQLSSSPGQTPQIHLSLARVLVCHRRCPLPPTGRRSRGDRAGGRIRQSSGEPRGSNGSRMSTPAAAPAQTCKPASRYARYKCNTASPENGATKACSSPPFTTPAAPVFPVDGWIQSTANWVVVPASETCTFPPVGMYTT